MTRTKTSAIISQQQIRDQTQLTPVGRPRNSQQPHQGPRIELVREGQVVKQIVVHCVCGEVITLDCDYAAPTGKSGN